MKYFLLTTLFGLIAGCSTPSNTVEGFDLEIFHTNDTHSHFAGNRHSAACNEEKNCTGGMGIISSTVQEARKKNPNLLFLDAGDQFQGSLLYSANRSDMVAAIDRLMGYDASTIGNHEFDEGCKRLAQYISELNYPILAANLDPKPSCPLHGAKYVPYTIVEIKNQKIGIIGLANDEVVGGSNACSDTRFIDPIEATTKAIKELEQKGINKIIVITHLGLPFDQELVRKIDGIDIVVGGHTHNYIGPGSPIGPYPIVEKTPSGKDALVVTTPGLTTHLGHIKLTFNQEGDLIGWSGLPIKLGKASGDPKITHEIELGNHKIAKLSKRIIGKNTVQYNDGLEECRHGPCLSGAFITQCMLNWAKPKGAVAAIINSGTIRGALPYGEVTAGDLLALQPFKDIVVLRRYSGRQLWQAIEHGVDEPGGIGPRVLQTTGIRYEYDPTSPVGERLKSVWIQDQQGRFTPLSLDKKYIVAINSFLASGGDHNSALGEGEKVNDSEILSTELMAEWFKKNKVLKDVPEQRFIRIQN